MDVRSGHLVADIDSIPESMRDLYRKVPKHLNATAQRKLAWQQSATVDISEPGELSDWARAEREWQTEKPTGKAAQRRLRQLAKAGK